MLSWWLASSPWDAQAGVPTGPPEWPYRGGLLHQPSRLVQAVNIVRAELPYATAKRAQQRRPPEGEAPPGKTVSTYRRPHSR